MAKYKKVYNDVTSGVGDTLSVSSVSGMWKVVSEVDTNVCDTTDYFFTLKNTPVAVYVNDLSTNGDIYCTAVGSDTNTGVSPAEPMDAIQRVLDTYCLSGGDTVYVDTGLYTNWVVFDGSDIGSAGNPLVIQGSTNYAAGVATVISNAGGTNVNFSYAPYIRLADMTLRGGKYGVYSINYSDYGQFYRVVCRDNSIAGIQCGGAAQTASTDPQIENCIFANNGSYQVYFWDSVMNVQIKNCSFWGGNAIFSRTGGSATLYMTNNCIWVSGSGKYVFPNYVLPNSSDYNIFLLNNGAGIIAACFSLTAFRTAYSSLDRHSQQTTNLFADPINYDFHLLSEMGRWTINGWIQDAVTSPGVDGGDTNSAYAREPKPNGHRINCGAYGNTGEASLTPRVTVGTMMRSW